MRGSPYYREPVGILYELSCLSEDGPSPGELAAARKELIDLAVEFRHHRIWADADQLDEIAAMMVRAACTLYKDERWPDQIMGFLYGQYDPYFQCRHYKFKVRQEVCLVLAKCGYATKGWTMSSGPHNFLVASWRYRQLHPELFDHPCIEFLT